MLMLSFCNSKLFAETHPPPSGHFHTDVVVQSSDHYSSEIVVPSGDH